MSSTPTKTFTFYPNLASLSFDQIFGDSLKGIIKPGLTATEPKHDTKLVRDVTGRTPVFAHQDGLISLVIAKSQNNPRRYTFDAAVNRDTLTVEDFKALRTTLSTLLDDVIRTLHS